MIDGRLAGLAVAAVALALRAPFIVVLVLAGAAGALAHVLARKAGSESTVCADAQV